VLLTLRGKVIKIALEKMLHFEREKLVNRAILESDFNLGSEAIKYREEYYG
jgi:hypothetical protein